MKKEVFTQEFEKCFTVFQQVQLMKQYLSEILDEIPEPDLSGKVDKTTSFTDTNGNTYNGTTGWVVENDKLAYEIKIHSSLLQDYNAFVHVGEDSIYLDNHYVNVSIDNERFGVSCDVNEGYYIECYVLNDGQTAINLTAGSDVLTLKSDEGLKYNGVQVGLYTQYLKFTITGDDNIPASYQISIDTFKPITSVEEFRNYIRNRLIYSDTPTFTTTILRYMLPNNTVPTYLAFTCAYYGTASCSISEIDADNNVTTIIGETDISVVTGRITNFEILATIRG